MPRGTGPAGPPLPGPPLPVRRWWVRRLVAVMLVAALLVVSVLCAIAAWRLLRPSVDEVCAPGPAPMADCADVGDRGLWGVGRDVVPPAATASGVVPAAAPLPWPVKPTAGPGRP